MSDVEPETSTSHTMSRSTVVFEDDTGGNLKHRRIRIRKKVKEERFIFKKGSSLFYFLASYALTPVDIYGIDDVWNVKDKLSIWHMLIIYSLYTLPLLYMKIFLGQYSRLNVLHIGKQTPIACGIGYTMLLSALIHASIFSTMLGDSFIYFHRGSKMPWLNCDEKISPKLNNYICIPFPKGRESGTDRWSDNRNARLSSYIYWRSEVLSINDSKVGHIGEYHDIERPVNLMIVWTLMFVILIVGIGLENKLDVFLRVRFWIIVVTGLFIAVIFCTTEGAGTHLSDIFKIDGTTFTNPRIYCFGISFVMVAASLTQGAYMLIGSYLKPDASAISTAFTIVAIHFFSGILGYVLTNSAHGILSSVYKVNRADLHLQVHDDLFATIPHAFGKVPLSRMVASVYFAFVFLICSGNIMTQIIVIYSSLVELKDEMKAYKSYVLGSVCFFGFIFGLLFTSEGGPNTYNCLNVHVIMVVRFIVIIVETSSALWLYAFPRLCDDIHFLYGTRPSKFWKIQWAFLPAITMVAFVIYLIDKDNLPSCHVGLHLGMFIILLAPFVIGAIYKTYKYIRKHNLVAVLKPDDDWGPRGKEDRKIRTTFVPRLETRLKRRTYTCKHNCLLNSECLKAVTAEEDTWYNYYKTEGDKEQEQKGDQEFVLSDSEEENKVELAEIAKHYARLSTVSNVSKDIKPSSSKSLS